MPFRPLSSVCLIAILAWSCGGPPVTTPDLDPGAKDDDRDGLSNHDDACPGNAGPAPSGCPAASPAMARAAAPARGEAEDDCEGEGGDADCEAEVARPRVIAAARPIAPAARPTAPARPYATGDSSKKARAVAILRELELIHFGLVNPVSRAGTCGELADHLRAWIERHDEEDTKVLPDQRGKNQVVIFSDIMLLVQAANDLELPPKDAAGEVEQAFKAYGLGLAHWDALPIVKRCAGDPALADIDGPAVARTLGSLPAELDDLFEGASQFMSEKARVEDAKNHARGLELMRGLFQHLDAFTGQVEAARGCAATLDVVRAWVKDGRYQKLEAEAREVDFPWQDPDLVLDAPRAEATQINGRYVARFARLVERLEAQSACFDTAEGNAVAKAFYEFTPLPDLDSIE